MLHTEPCPTADPAKSHQTEQAAATARPSEDTGLAAHQSHAPTKSASQRPPERPTAERIPKPPAAIQIATRPTGDPELDWLRPSRDRGSLQPHMRQPAPRIPPRPTQHTLPARSRALPMKSARQQEPGRSTVQPRLATLGAQRLPIPSVLLCPKTRNAPEPRPRALPPTRSAQSRHSPNPAKKPARPESSSYRPSRPRRHRSPALRTPL
jgi:hypothetical protein